uniref:Uncharacterized protein n=1 Tax=Populus alba TaxID=43335 RepID=A0A4U5P6N7_POPAL|nr:hypothetical protein D5086_0000224600 [Populus alba]
MEDNHKKTPKRCRSHYRQGPGGKVVLGTSNRFVLYLGSSVKNAVKTDWVYTSMLLLIILRLCLSCVSFQCPSGSQSNELVRTSRLIDGNMSADAETAQQLLSILEGESF